MLPYCPPLTSSMACSDGLDVHHAQHRAEDLGAGDCAARRQAVQHGRAQEVAALVAGDAGRRARPPRISAPSATALADQAFDALLALAA